MAHKKYYYVLIALVVIMVFGTAAICNLCGAGAATTDKTGTDEETAAASTAKSTDGTTDKDGKDLINRIDGQGIRSGILRFILRVFISF